MTSPAISLPVGLSTPARADIEIARLALHYLVRGLAPVPAPSIAVPNGAAGSATAGRPSPGRGVAGLPGELAAATVRPNAPAPAVPAPTTGDGAPGAAAAGVTNGKPVTPAESVAPHAAGNAFTAPSPSHAETVIRGQHAIVRLLREDALLQLSQPGYRQLVRASGDGSPPVALLSNARAIPLARPDAGPTPPSSPASYALPVGAGAPDEVAAPVDDSVRFVGRNVDTSEAGGLKAPDGRGPYPFLIKVGPDPGSPPPPAVFGRLQASPGPDAPRAPDVRRAIAVALAQELARLQRSSRVVPETIPGEVAMALAVGVAQTVQMPVTGLPGTRSAPPRAAAQETAATGRPAQTAALRAIALAMPAERAERAHLVSLLSSEPAAADQRDPTFVRLATTPAERPLPLPAMADILAGLVPGALRGRDGAERTGRKKRKERGRQRKRGRPPDRGGVNPFF